MNIKTDDNHVAALIDTRDGKRYRDNAFDAFGVCLEQHLMDTINGKVEQMLPGRNDMKLGNEMLEAFAIVSSFLEVGRQEDKRDTSNEVSQEALRHTAMFVASAFYLMSFDARLFKETFNETWQKFEGKLTQDDRLAGYLIYMTENFEGLKRRNAMSSNVMRGIMSVISDVVTMQGLRDTSESSK